MKRLAELREPPVPGRTYLVPVVEDYPYFARRDDWPVIGPRHADGEFFNFPDPHYHVDPRFLTEGQARFIARRAYLPDKKDGSARRLDMVVGSYPLSSRGSEVPKGLPVLKPRRCRASTYGYAYSGNPAIRALNEAFEGRQAAICMRDGRKLCPHRKVDLSTFLPDDNGFVTCPLHGLRVQMGADPIGGAAA